jgi:hypothetical protein
MYAIWLANERVRSCVLTQAIRLCGETASSRCASEIPASYNWGKPRAILAARGEGRRASSNPGRSRPISPVIVNLHRFELEIDQLAATALLVRHSPPNSQPNRSPPVRVARCGALSEAQAAPPTRH